LLEGVLLLPADFDGGGHVEDRVFATLGFCRSTERNKYNSHTIFICIKMLLIFL